MDYTISYFSEAVQEDIFALPDTLAARYVVLSRRMIALGPNLGEPHTKAFGEGLFEMWLKGAEGIGRVFFCTLVGKRIVMLHSFVKKSDRTPLREREIAQTRMKEFKHANIHHPLQPCASTSMLVARVWFCRLREAAAR